MTTLSLTTGNIKKQQAKKPHIRSKQTVDYYPPELRDRSSHPAVYLTVRRGR